MSDCLKMTWAHTTRAHAKVIDFQAGGNWPFLRFVCPSMSRDWAVFDAEPTIVSALSLPFGTRPIPAVPQVRPCFRKRAVLVNFEPKTFGSRALIACIASEAPALVVFIAPATRPCLVTAAFNRTSGSGWSRWSGIYSLWHRSLLSVSVRRAGSTAPSPSILAVYRLSDPACSPCSRSRNAAPRPHSISA